MVYDFGNLKRKKHSLKKRYVETKARSDVVTFFLGCLEHDNMLYKNYTNICSHIAIDK